MPRNSLTVASIQEEVNASLGSSGVSVELESADYQKCLFDMIRVYNRNRPGRIRFMLPVTPQQKKYGPLGYDNFGNVIIPTIQGVVAVSFVTNQAPVTDPFDTINNGIGRVLSGSGTPFGEIDQQLQYIKMARNVAASEPEHQVDWEGDKLFIFIDIARTPVLCSLEVSFHYTPDDATYTGIGYIPDGDTDFIVGYVAARAKQILGRIRIKHGGVMNPDGQMDPIDGEALVTEGKTEEDEWLEKILSRRRPLLPILG
jgi:hypothetical protein